MQLPKSLTTDVILKHMLTYSVRYDFDLFAL